MIAYKFLDSIVNIIRTKDEPKKIIIKKYKLTENQVEAILNMRLGSLKKLDELETKKEIKKLTEKLYFLNKLIKNKKFLDGYLIKDIESINEELLDNQYNRKQNTTRD